MNSYCKKIRDKFSKEKLKKRTESLRWIYQYAKPYTLLIIIYTLIGLSGTVVSLVSSLISRDLVDIITGHKTGELIKTFVMMFVATIGVTLTSQLTTYLSTKISLTIEKNIKAKVFDQIMAAEWESLSQYRPGDLSIRLGGDVGQISSGILTLVPNTIIFTFQFISALWMVCIYDASFAVFALVSVPISLLISRGSLKLLQKNNMGSLAISSKMSSFNHEAFSNIQLLKSFDILSVYSKRLRVLQDEYMNVRLRYQKYTILNSILLMILSLLVSYSAQGWGIYKVWSGAITYGTMTMFLSLATTLTSTANSLISIFPNSIMLTNAASRLMEITELPKEDYEHRLEVKDFYNKHMNEGISIHLQGITFSYRDSETNVFQNAHMYALPGEVVALVGPSGEGKTTMLRYLLSLIQGSGNAYIGAGNRMPDTNNLESGYFMPISASIRQLIAYVPQGNTMFFGTIAENMRNVKEDATDEEIIDALKMACAWEFIESLPDGINSQIKENGGGFSEGQAQRLSIARAILRKSPILMLDEATSALDIATERKVLKNIMTDKCVRTCIVTTHRPTVLTSCDRVYAIRDKQCFLLNNDEIEDLIHGFSDSNDM